MRHTTVADVMSTNVISARPQDSFAHLTTLLRGAAIRAPPATRRGGGGVLGTSAARLRSRRRARPQRPSS